MHAVDRRSFLIRGGVGAAGAATALGGGLAGLAGAAAAAPLSDEELTALDQPVLVRVLDAARGEVELLVGDREVVFTDRRLVATVLRARS